MASVYQQRERSKYWIARYRMADGQWVAKTTKSTDRSIALRIAFEMEGLAASPDELNSTRAAVARMVRDIVERTTREKVETVRVGTYLRDWSSRMSATKAENTGERYRQVIEEFLKHLGPEGEKRNIASIQPKHLQGFIDAGSRQGKSGQTVSLAGKILFTAFKSAQRAGHIEANPAASLELPDATSREREEFTPGELEAILAEAKGTEWETVILLGAYCGCRLGDAVTMRWDAVDLTAGRIQFVPQKTSRGKRRKTLEMPINSRLREHLEMLASREDSQQSEFVSPIMAAKPVSGRTGLSMSFIKLMRQAGVAGKTEQRKEGSAGRSFTTKSFHSLRHFFVSQLRRAGADLESAQAAAGHSDGKTHARYDHDKHDRVYRQLSTAFDKMPGAKKKAALP
jgi:integrase